MLVFLTRKFLSRDAFVSYQHEIKKKLFLQTFLQTKGKGTEVCIFGVTVKFTNNATGILTETRKIVVEAELWERSILHNE